MNHENGRSQSRPTEILSRPTEVLSRPTDILSRGPQPHSENHFHTLNGTIAGYRITDTLSENNGEAAIFLCDKGGEVYVAKVYHQNKRPKQETLEIIRNLTSPYIVPILEDGYFQNRFYEIQPYYQNKDLHQSGELDVSFLLEVVIPNINEGLYALHSKGIIHRDIKPTNLFYSHNKQHIVIGDFGISSKLGPDSTVRETSFSRSIVYAAPETASGIISKKVDYYSLGVTLLHLATGKEPCQGMTDTQILMLTLNYKLSIPTSIHPRLAKLIRGLTVKDPQDRWGYEEVNMWLNHENIPIVEVFRKSEDIRPYRFEGEEFHDLPSLALAVASNWTEGIKHLYRGFLAKHIEQFGQDLASKTIDCSEERNQDLGLFKLIYLLNPQAPLCWRREMFMDLFKFLEKMNKELPNLNDDFMDLISSGAFLHYIEVKGFSENAKKEFKQIYENYGKSQDKSQLYYRIAMALQSAEENANPFFRFSKSSRNFYSPDELMEYLYHQRDHLETISKELLENPYFFIWLESMGYKQHVEEWKKINY